ncbi:helix-turn-helix domain-containing protein [Bacteroides sp. OttesenSCG-928-D19]|nr:helix-turn-helix domain-containing protein [Bacteroides sp. OttesenSCG-928-D19]
MEKILEKLERIEALTILAAKNVLNIDDVVILTGLSKSWLYKATCTHQIPHYKPAKQIYFDRKEVEEWMKQNRIATTQELEEVATNYVVTGKMGGK